MGNHIIKRRRYQEIHQCNEWLCTTTSVGQGELLARCTWTYKIPIYAHSSQLSLERFSILEFRETNARGDLDELYIRVDKYIRIIH